MLLISVIKPCGRRTNFSFTTSALKILMIMYSFCYFDLIILMSREPLVSSAIQEKPLSELPLISRYNIFVENYNKPNCQIVGKALDKLP